MYSSIYKHPFPRWHTEGIFEQLADWLRELPLPQSPPPEILDALKRSEERPDTESLQEFIKLFEAKDGDTREYAIKICYNIIRLNDNTDWGSKGFLVQAFVDALIALPDLESDRKIGSVAIDKLTLIVRFWPDRGLHRKIVPMLTDIIYKQHGDLEVRKAALAGLEDFLAEDGGAILDALIWVLRTGDAAARMESCIMLAKLGAQSPGRPRGVALAQVLVGVITNDSDLSVRFKALEALLSLASEEEIMTFLDSNHGSALKGQFISEMSFVGEKGDALRRRLSGVEEDNVKSFSSLEALAGHFHATVKTLHNWETAGKLPRLEPSNGIFKLDVTKYSHLRGRLK